MVRREAAVPRGPYNSVPIFMASAEGATLEDVDGNRYLDFAGGIGCLSLWFFLWLGLLRNWDLSRLFPFEGLSPPLTVLAAWMFLGERVSPRTVAAIVMIGIGVALVARD